MESMMKIDRLKSFFSFNLNLFQEVPYVTKPYSIGCGSTPGVTST